MLSFLHVLKLSVRARQTEETRLLLADEGADEDTVDELTDLYSASDSERLSKRTDLKSTHRITTFLF